MLFSQPLNIDLRTCAFVVAALLTTIGDLCCRRLSRTV